MAEAEGHHPDLHLEGFNNVVAEVTTHAAGEERRVPGVGCARGGVGTRSLAWGNAGGAPGRGWHAQLAQRPASIAQLPLAPRA